MLKLPNGNDGKEAYMDGKNLKFKAWLVEHDIKQQEIADLLGITLGNVNEKLNGKQEFTTQQIRTLCQQYGLTSTIFFE